jgi:exosortase/archaeosortase family protein
MALSESAEFHPDASAEARGDRPRSAPRAAVAQLAVLLVLWVWAFRPEFVGFVVRGWVDSNWAHALAAPFLILFLILRRRQCLARCRWKGSAWGLIGVLGGIILYAASIWPLNFGYTRDLATVPVLAGIVLGVGGWGVLRRTVPMLLIFLLSIPIGQRAYAAMIIRPETVTLTATRLALDRLPGVEVRLEGPDLHFARGDRRGVIALGESNRGAALLVTCAVIGVFVVFCHLRPFWQVVLLAAAAVPIMLLCNLLRLLTWGLVTVYAGTDPVSAAPRVAAAVVSLLVAYGAFALGCAILSYIGGQGDGGTHP